MPIRERRQLGFVTLNGNLTVSGWWFQVMNVNAVTKSHVKISFHNSREILRYDFKGPLNVQLHKKFYKCDDLYSEISVKFRSITIIFV